MVSEKEGFASGAVSLDASSSDVSSSGDCSWGMERMK